MPGDPKERIQDDGVTGDSESPILDGHGQEEAAPEEAKQDVDKIDFTTEGETLGYISLDQARVLALRLAREDTDAYGTEYSGIDLAWEITNAEDGEDYYQIRISFRPVQNFAGEPGTELFTIDKLGTLESRQVLTFPSPRRRLLAGGLVLGGIVSAVAIVVILLVSGVFSTDLTGQAAGAVQSKQVASQVLIPNEPVAITSPTGDVEINVPTGAVATSAMLYYVPVTPAEMPPLAPGFIATNKVFDIKITDETGSPSEITSPIKISISLDPAIVALADKDPSRIVIQHHDGTDWQVLDTEVVLSTLIASAEVMDFSPFALTVKAVESAQGFSGSLGNAPATTPTPTSIPTATPEPTAIPTPEPTSTLIPVPTPTSVPTPTPAPTPTPTPVPMPTPIFDDHGDTATTATVTELRPEVDFFSKTSMITIYGELETPDDVDYFSFEAYGGYERFKFSPAFLPLATSTGGGTPKIAIYGGSWFSPLEMIDSFKEYVYYTPPSAGIIYLMVSNSNPRYTGKYRVVVERINTTLRPIFTKALEPLMLSGIPTPAPTPTPRPTATPTPRPTASPTILPFTLVTNANPPGAGTVIGGGAYLPGAIAPVTATQSTGYTFDNWSGNCIGTALCNVTMDSDKAVTANFSRSEFTLITNSFPAAGGTIAGGGTYPIGTVVNVTQVANAGSTFDNWSGDCSGAGSCDVTMDADKAVTANYSGTLFTLTATADPVAGGTVTGGGTYAMGTVVPVTQVVNAGFTFDNWSGDCSGTGPCNVTMDADKAVTANYSGTLFTLTATADPVAGGTVTGGGTYSTGAAASVTQVANAGFTFDNWSGDCSGAGLCNVTMNADKTVGANYSATPFVVLFGSDDTSDAGEDGSTYVAWVYLESQPSSEAVLSLASGDTGEVTLSPATLTFTTSNWNDKQYVTFTGVDDTEQDGDQEVAIVITDNYGRDHPGISVENVDDDSLDWHLERYGETGNVEVSETGTQYTFYLKLWSQPSSDAVVGVEVFDTGEVSVSPSTVTFTGSNWNSLQAVTLTGVDDTDLDGDQTTTITVFGSGDAFEDGGGISNGESLTVITADDEVLEWHVNPSDQSNSYLVGVSETGSTSGFGISLKYQPESEEAITIVSSDTGEVTVSPGTLTFTNSNWDSMQTVTVTGVDDTDDDGDQTTTITISGVGDDWAGDENLYVVTEDDEPTLPSSLTVLVNSDQDWGSWGNGSYTRCTGTPCGHLSSMTIHGREVYVKAHANAHDPSSPWYYAYIFLKQSGSQTWPIQYVIPSGAWHAHRYFDSANPWGNWGDLTVTANYD